MGQMVNIDAVKASDLPKAWRDKLDLEEGDVVKVTVEKVEEVKPKDVKKIREIVDEIHRLPVLDDRSADEIIGYDKYGLPT